jgi:hypothetical protein
LKPVAREAGFFMVLAYNESLPPYKEVEFFCTVDVG